MEATDESLLPQDFRTVFDALTGTLGVVKRISSSSAAD